MVDTDLTQTLEHLVRLSSMLMRHPLAFLDASERCEVPAET